MDGTRREITGGGMFIQDGWIKQVDHTSALPREADEIIDLAGYIVLPGFVNTHHHFFQTIHRGMLASQRAHMRGWLQSLSAYWSKLRPEHVRLATEITLIQLAKSGCTTVVDNQYLWPNDIKADDHFEAASRIPIRFHFGRGFQNIDQSRHGFLPKQLIEKDDDIIADCERVIEAYHDSSEGALSRIFLAPTSLRSVSAELLEDTAAIARERGVQLHMHLGQAPEETEFSLQKFGVHPLRRLEKSGWHDADAWFAHGVHIDDEEIDILVEKGWGICLCPSSDLRLGSGVVAAGRYVYAGVPLGLGLDGAADSSNFLAEIRMALLLSRSGAHSHAGTMLDARKVLEWATLGGANLLTRSDIGRLQAGCTADFIAIDINRIELVGALDDPIAALAHCVVPNVDHSWVHGRQIVRDGCVLNTDVPVLIEQYRSAFRELDA
jgi:cytosine/adenosine deaminase-related metal-dependent hydrolase